MAAFRGASRIVLAPQPTDYGAPSRPMTQEINFDLTDDVWYRYVDPMSPIELWLPEDEHEELATETSRGYEVAYAHRERGFFTEDNGSTPQYNFHDGNVTTHPESEVPFPSR